MLLTEKLTNWALVTPTPDVHLAWVITMAADVLAPDICQVISRRHTNWNVTIALQLLVFRVIKSVCYFANCNKAIESIIQIVGYSAQHINHKRSDLSLQKHPYLILMANCDYCDHQHDLEKMTKLVCINVGDLSTFWNFLFSWLLWHITVPV